MKSLSFLIVTIGLCFSSTLYGASAHVAPPPKLYCVNDAGEHITLTGHETPDSLIKGINNKLGLKFAIVPNNDKLNGLFLILFEGSGCRRLSNGICENITFNLDANDLSQSEFYITEMEINWVGKPQEILKGDQMCSRTMSILRGQSR